jgi:hypothetical protein
MTESSKTETAGRIVAQLIALAILIAMLGLSLLLEHLKH